ncbi:MAG TPA: secondary thiamine-phosphate synthase enzyme YjbQ [Nitrososphaeraceae archaeon]|jgi:secondary thiamine-phosphate synthase enzyme|nr:secondary thiamine-phosphate synthase enzyme YjbQ [Nitrososphaeraceae archaeon]
MNVVTKVVQLRSSKENDIIDVTKQTSDALRESGLNNGIINVFVAGSTAAITTIEYEPGLRHDFPKMLSRIAPEDIQYRHDETWHDGNGHSHVRASLVGPSLTVPFSNGVLILGTWQQIVMLEMDTKPRERVLTMQILGE